MKNVMTGNLVKWTFEDNVPPLTFDCTKASGANRAQALVYGFNVRLTRMAALPRADKNGNVITVTERMRHDAVAEGIAHYESATDAWEMRTVRAPTQNPVWAAMAEKRGVGYDVIAAEHAQADLDVLAAM